MLGHIMLGHIMLGNTRNVRNILTSHVRMLYESKLACYKMQD